jgi:NAD(P)-dependent dehydrogenase (short-subunit alcohol dehydrogenase family)
MQHLDGKVAVVTGAASGIGLAMAQRFAREGMKLTLVDIEAGALEAAAAELASGGADVFAQRVDVSDADQMDGLAQAVLDRFGAVHLVCNNAGVATGGPLWDVSTADWEFVIRPNLWGVIHGVRVFTKHLIAQDEGHIVNTASLAGLVSVPGFGPYNVTKHAVVTLSETLHGELVALGSKVGVSVLCPGFVTTRLWDSDRNWPEDLPPRDPQLPEQEEQVRAVLKALIEAGISTDPVIEEVMDAIVNQRFYILTHEGSQDAVEQRMGRIIRGENPVTPAEGIGIFTPSS